MNAQDGMVLYMKCFALCVSLWLRWSLQLSSKHVGDHMFAPWKFAWKQKTRRLDSKAC